MDAVILFSHGSVLCGSGMALEAHAERLRERGAAEIVAVGYLNYSEPTFANAVASCVEAGATRLIVAPYFLAPGYFVKVDLPRVVAEAQTLFPESEFVIAEPIGYDDLLADALTAAACSARPAAFWREDLLRAAQFCRANPKCLLFDTPDCPRHPGSKTSALSPAPVLRDVTTLPASRPRGRLVEGSTDGFILCPEIQEDPRPHAEALLVLIHGSPRPIANADMFRVVEAVRQRGAYPIVEVGFLECNEPDIPTAIDRCVVQGATRILAVPYFLHTGTHVADDLPALLEQSQQRYSDVEFLMGDYLGRSQLLTRILADRVNAIIYGSKCLALLLLVLFWMLTSCRCLAQSPTELLKNGGFEGGSGGNGTGGGVPRWEAFESGYDVDRQTHHGGDQAIRCDSLRPKTLRGALADVTLNQTHPSPIIVTGWSKADQVSGARDSDYSLYVDLVYTDGTPLWGQSTSYRVGTHDWERRQVLVLPAKPVKTMRVYALFRNHTGTAWFDDFSAHQLDGAGIFDGQPLLPLPKRAAASPAQLQLTGGGLNMLFSQQGDLEGLKAGDQGIGSPTVGGLWVRDVGADTGLIPVQGSAGLDRVEGLRLEADAVPAQLHVSARFKPENRVLTVEGTVTDLSNKERAVTVYLTLPVGGAGWRWDRDIRHTETINAQQEFTNQTHVTVGATGGLSLYPFGCIVGQGQGIAIANQMDMPGVYRIFYNGPTRQLVIAWDIALSARSLSWPAHTGRFKCSIYRVAPAWGFRDAAQRFYRLNAPNFDRLAKSEGIWMPFTDPSRVAGYADFGFSYHEGDNSLKSDDALGILSFRYTEPMSYWLPMPPAMPRTYENALTLINKNAADSDPKHKEARDMARAVLNSGSQDESGHFNLEFRNEPWANGAVFILNPNPEMAASADKPTKAYLSYTPEMAAKIYGKAESAQRGIQDGEYLDSLESWTDMQDYRPASIASLPYPLTFDVDSRRPVVPQWFSTHTFTRFLRDDLHNRSKLLMANTVPVRFAIYAPLLDVMGIEVNWLDSAGHYNPDSDETLNFRRTLSAAKPYLLLMNTDYEKFTYPMVEKYFQRSMFYGIYPSMFSANAADHPYWEEPKWYNRDRPLFKQYIPLIKRLSAAGWEPVTNATSSKPAVYVERFGSGLFTLLNDSDQPADTTLTLNLHDLGLPPIAARRIVNLTTGIEVTSQLNGTNLTVKIHLEAQQATALELK